MGGGATIVLFIAFISTRQTSRNTFVYGSHTYPISQILNKNVSSVGKVFRNNVLGLTGQLTGRVTSMLRHYDTVCSNTFFCVFKTCLGNF
jgi:hypothetical protein